MDSEIWRRDCDEDLSPPSALFLVYACTRDVRAKLVHCILENGYALAMIAGWHPNV